MNGPWVHDSKQARLWANQLVFNASILYPKVQCYTQCEKEKKTFWWKSATSAVNSKAPKFFLNPKTVTKTKSVNSKAFQIEQKNKQTKKHPKLKNKNKKPLFLKKKPWKHFWYLPRYENEKRKKMKFSNFWMLNDWIWLSQVRIVEGKTVTSEKWLFLWTQVRLMFWSIDRQSFPVHSTWKSEKWNIMR